MSLRIKIGLILAASILAYFVIKVFYELYLYKALFSEFKIINIPASNPMEYPYVRWSDITSGKLSFFLNNDNTLIKNVSKNTFISYKTLSKELYEARGINYYLPEIDTMDDTYNQNNLNVAYFRTGLGGVNYVLIIQKIVIDNSIPVFIPLIIPMKSILEDNGELNNYFGQLTSTDRNIYFSPVVQIKDISTCRSRYVNYKSYCNWIFNPLNNKAKFIVSDKYNENIGINKSYESIPFIPKNVLLNY